MSRLNLSPLRLVLLSLLGSGIVLAAAIVAVMALWQPRPLEAMLPADRTLALFSNVSREDLRMFTGMYPPLKDVPDFSGTLNLGIVSMGSNPPAWVLTSLDVKHPLPSTNLTIDHQHVLTSDPGIEPLLISKTALWKADTTRLRSAMEYLDLVSAVPVTAQQIYLRQGPATGAAGVPVALRPFFHASGSLLIASTDSAIMIRMAGQSPVATVRPMSTTLSLLTPDPDFSIRLSDPGTILTTSMNARSQTDATMATGILTQNIHELLGGEWSYRYDILPLIAGETTLHLRQNGGQQQGNGQAGGSASPAVSFLLEGRTDDPKTTEQRLAAFHEQFRAQWTGTVLHQRTLGKFTSAILESDPSHVSSRRYSTGGWTVTETRKGSGGLLISAMRGQQFLMGNLAAWTASAIAGTHTAGIPAGLRDPIAGGRLSPMLVTKTTADVVNTPVWAWIREKLPPGKDVLWSLQIDGHGGTLSLTLPRP